MRRLLLLILVGFALPLQLLAHGYWIELEGDYQPNHPLTIKLIFGEYALLEKLTGDKLDRMKHIKVEVLLPNGNRQPISMSQQNDCWKGSFTPATDGSYTIIGINDERDVQDWTKHNLGIVRPIQYLKAVYAVGTGKEVKTTQLFDMTVQPKSKNEFELRLTRNGQVCDTCNVAIVNPKGETEDVKTGSDGKAVFNAAAPGLYIISVEWIDKNAGVFKNKPYQTTRHRLDYSLYVL